MAKKEATQAETAHWVDDEEQRKRWWAAAKKVYPDESTIHEKLNVSSMREWEGTGAEALAALKLAKEADEAEEEAAAVEGYIRDAIRPGPALGFSVTVPAGMPRIKTLSVRYSRRFRPEEYEGVEGECGLWADMEGGTPDELLEATEAMVEYTSDVVAHQTAPVMVPVLRRRREFSEAVENGLQRPAGERKARESHPAPQPPPGGNGSGGNGGGEHYEEFTVDHIVATQTQTGKQNWRVKGGRFMTHGVVAWEEVIADLDDLFDLDVSSLKLGERWTPRFQLVAVGWVPDGKKNPRKVVEFRAV